MVRRRTREEDNNDYKELQLKSEIMIVFTSKLLHLKYNMMNNPSRRVVHLLTISTQPACLFACLFDRFVTTAQNFYVIITSLSVTFRAVNVVTVVRTF